ncbi:MAG: hypothetical protein KDD48_06650 [Bdellovibrionales bacterium]|nr:hypothetical protein [Bdellovibrionales bacterium]
MFCGGWSIAKRCLLLSLVFCAAFSKVNAGFLCPFKEKGSPLMAFTITASKPGELDRHCEDDIAVAVKKGFTAVTLSPMFLAVETYYPDRQIRLDKYYHKLSGEDTLLKGEVTRCLEHIWNSGLHLIYLPHVEHADTLCSDEEVYWRANLRVLPDRQYHNVMFKEFLEFLRQKIDEGVNRDTVVDVLPVAELEYSFYSEVEAWTNYIHFLKNEVATLMPYLNIRLGANLNWRPKIPDILKNESPYQCQALNELVDLFDYVAPSAYMSWLPKSEKETTNLVEMRLSDLRNYLSRDIIADSRKTSEEHFRYLQNNWYTKKKYKHGICKVSAFHEKDMYIGEFGLGGDLSQPNKNVQPDNKEKYIESRYKILKHIFSELMSKDTLFAETTGPSFWNFWTLGVFDPFSIREDPLVISDPRITELLQTYKEWQCNDINVKSLYFDPFSQQLLFWVESTKATNESIDLTIENSRGEKIFEKQFQGSVSGHQRFIVKPSIKEKGIYWAIFQIDGQTFRRSFLR